MSFTNTDTPLLIRLHRQFPFFAGFSASFAACRSGWCAIAGGAAVARCWRGAGAVLARRYRDIGAAQAAAAVGASILL